MRATGMPANERWHGAIAPALWLLGLLPLAAMIYRFQADTLGANPIEAITHGTGDWALRLLLVVLAVSPVQRLCGWAALQRTRRPLGLLAFTYASLHLCAYLWLDQFFAWGSILRDIGHRPFITLGFAGFVLLAPLAATSFSAAKRWLGPARWQLLHRAAYPAAVLAVLHYAWLVKRDLREPLLYALILMLIYGARFIPRRTKG